MKKNNLTLIKSCPGNGVHYIEIGLIFAIFRRMNGRLSIYYELAQLSSIIINDKLFFANINFFINVIRLRL